MMAVESVEEIYFSSSCGHRYLCANLNHQGLHSEVERCWSFKLHLLCRKVKSLEYCGEAG